MVRLVAIENVGYVPYDAFRARVVLAWARCPFARVLDVHLARRVDVSEELSRENWHKVFLIVYVIKVRNVGVNIVCKCLIPNLMCIQNLFQQRMVVSEPRWVYTYPR